VQAFGGMAKRAQFRGSAEDLHVIAFCMLRDRIAPLNFSEVVNLSEARVRNPYPDPLYPSTAVVHLELFLPGKISRVITSFLLGNCFSSQILSKTMTVT